MALDKKHLGYTVLECASLEPRPSASRQGRGAEREAMPRFNISGGLILTWRVPLGLICVLMALRRPKRRKLHFQKKVILKLTTANEATWIPRLIAAGSQARYVSSPYHRPSGSKMGRPVGRKWAHTSKCNPKWSRADATRALRQAITAGNVSPIWDGGFPLHVWYMDDDDVLYEARLSNRESGEYHAYPLEDRREWPKNFQPKDLTSA